MEVFMKAQNDLPEYAPQGLSKSSPKTRLENPEDFDFNDVFGGPPRRFCMREMHSFGDTVALELKEKPVFGEDKKSVARRRHLGDDFFDDIFRGDESYCSPRRENLFGSSPGSRIMSPAKPLSPKTDPFGTSVPAQFSLPAKLIKVEDVPLYATQICSQYKMNGSANGFGSPRSSSASLSRFSNQASKDEDKMRNEVHTVYRQCLSSQEAYFSSEDSPCAVKSDKKEKVSVDSNGKQFHFSIYKWPGVPMVMHLVGRNGLRSKDSCRFDKCASSNGRIDSKLSTMRNEVLSENIKSENVRKKTEKEVSIKIKESLKSEVKPFHAFLEQPGKTTEMKEDKIITPKNAKRNKGTGIDSDRRNADKSSLQGTDVDSEATPGKSAVKGKMRDFIQIFNQEADSRPKSDVQTGSKSYRWTGQKQTEVDENLIKDEAQQCTQTKTPVYRSNNFSTNQKTAYSSEWDSKTSEEESSDDPFEDNFQVQELSEDLQEVTQNSEGSEDMKALEAKIRQWAVGKKGNIRSLLSTLQYVLWPGSGWKPIPLVDLIESNSVKRAYQKALLRLHPDKLQQKDAASHQKCIAEMVFDILQEAWDHFNSLAPL